MRLADRAIQFADLRPVSAEAHYACARAWHSQGDVEKALQNYVLAVKERPDFLAARLASAQLMMLSK